MVSGPIYAKIFGHSPQRYLKDHVVLIREIMLLASKFHESAQRGDWSVCAEIFSDIEEVERNADQVKAKFQLQLPRGVFMPVYRSDLLEIMLILDRIPNEIKDFLGISLGRELAVPGTAAEAFSNYLRLGADCVQLLEKLIVELDDLFRSGFSDREIEAIGVIATDISTLEHQADQDRIALNRMLRAAEAHESAIDMMFVYQMLGLIAGVSDHCQEAGYRVVAMITR